MKTVIIQNKKILIERRPYILDGKIQPVYKYFIDDKLVLTFYTNGFTEILYPVYHELNIWSKKQLDDLLADLLPNLLTLKID